VIVLPVARFSAVPPKMNVFVVQVTCGPLKLATFASTGPPPCWMIVQSWFA
jgi:hypothetical protein